MSSGGSNPALAWRGWQLVQARHLPEESGFFDSLFALSDGYIGVRPTLEPESALAVPGTFFIDLYGPALAVRSEIAKAPSWHAVRFRLDGEPLDWDAAELLEFERSLDLRRGELVTSARVRHGGDGAGERLSRIEWRLVVLAGDRHAGLVQGTVTAENWSGPAALESWLDARFGNAYMGGLTPEVETHHFRPVAERWLPAGGVLLEAELAGSGECLAIASRLAVDAPARRRPLRRHRAAGELVSLELAAGRPAGFRKLATFFHSRDAERPAAAAVAHLDELGAAPAGAPLERHRQVWERRWRDRDVEIDEIEGDEGDAAALRFGLFHLGQAIDHDRGSYNIPARGLTSEYHSGHGFFNTEFFKLPYWIFTDPARARALLTFRAETLAAARRHAADTGYRGARYPEEVDAEGEPASPWEIRELWTGRVYHEWSGPETMFLSPAVACGVDWYWKATGDDEFMRRHGVEMLLETARFGHSLLTWPPGSGSFSIRSVMGPDEYHYHVDDNLFTNFAVARSMRLGTAAFRWLERADPDGAARLAAAIGCDAAEREAWERAAAAMPAPGRLAGGVLEQFSGYALLPDQRAGEPDPLGRPTLDDETASLAQALGNFSTKLIKEADVVLLHALFPDAFGDEQKALDLDFYEPRTTFESSLAASPYGIVTAMLGRPDAARRYFRLAACYNLGFEPRAGYRNGVHLAAYAGAWQVLVQGLLGVRLGEEALTFRPRPLPEVWRSLRLRLVWRGAPLGLRLTREELAIDAAPRGIRVPIADGRRDRAELDLGGGRRALVEVGEVGR